MLESILYNTSKSAIPLVLFCGLVIIIGFLMDVTTRKFDINKKNAIYGGTLAGLNKLQVIALSAVFVRTFLINFSVYTYSENIWLYITMIILAEIVYIFTNIRRIVFEIVNTTAQLSLVYIINILANYKMKVGNDKYVQYVQIILTVFISLYFVYFLLKNIEEIISRKYKKTSK